MNGVIGKVLSKARERDKNKARRDERRKDPKLVEEDAAYKRKNYQANYDKIRAGQHDYRQKHLKEESANHSAYFQKNKRTLTDKYLAYKKKRRLTDPGFVANERCHQRLKNYLKTNGNAKKLSTFGCVGKTPKQLVKYLGCSTDIINGDIDHIFPVSRFGANQDNRVMHFSNLQLLTSFENNWKKNRLPTKAMASKVERWAWPDGITEDMLPDIYHGWATPLRMHATPASSTGAGASSSNDPLPDDDDDDYLDTIRNLLLSESEDSDDSDSD